MPLFIKSDRVCASKKRNPPKRKRGTIGRAVGKVAGKTKAQLAKELRLAKAALKRVANSAARRAKRKLQTWDQTNVPGGGYPSTHTLKQGHKRARSRETRGGLSRAKLKGKARRAAAARDIQRYGDTFYPARPKTYNKKRRKK